MNIYGRVFEICPPISGQSSTGSWTRQTIVIQSFDNPNQFSAFDALNERVKLLEGITVGMAVTITGNPASRKHEDKWFTTLNLWDIKKL